MEVGTGRGCIRLPLELWQPGSRVPAVRFARLLSKGCLSRKLPSCRASALSPGSRLELYVRKLYLKLYLGGRCGYSTQRLEAIVDGNVIGTWTVPPGMPFTLETATFTVTTGSSHVLEFMGLNPSDTTAFLSYVVITPTRR